MVQPSATQKKRLESHRSTNSSVPEPKHEVQVPEVGSQRLPITNTQRPHLSPGYAGGTGQEHAIVSKVERGGPDRTPSDTVHGLGRARL